MDVCVRLLGRFELTCDGAVVIDGAWKPAKAAAIVKILALREGRSMHRDQLIAALWPEADAEAGTNSLYKNLHELRKTIRKAGGPRDVVHLNHPAIALAPYVRVDLDEVRRLAAAADRRVGGEHRPRWRARGQRRGAAPRRRLRAMERTVSQRSPATDDTLSDAACGDAPGSRGVRRGGRALRPRPGSRRAA